MAAILIGCVFIGLWESPATAQASVIGEVRQDQITFVELEALLASRSNYGATFQETHYSHLLTEPLTTSGTLIFNPPSRIEKRVTLPYEETYFIDENTVRVEIPEKGISNSISLNEVPSLQGFLLGVRSVLLGDLEYLNQVFSLKLRGTKTEWTLSLEPLEDPVKEFLSSVTITGQNNRIITIELRESNGDHSLMVIHQDTT